LEATMASLVRRIARWKVGSSTAHWTSVRSMPSSTTAILPMFPVDAARLSGQLFSEVRAAERPCAKYQQ
jgi:hypothetical protein